jgi:hypothetical protein
MDETLERMREQFQQIADEGKSPDETAVVTVVPVGPTWRASVAIQGKDGPLAVHSFDFDAPLAVVRSDFPARLRGVLDERRQRVAGEGRRG